MKVYVSRTDWFCDNGVDIGQVTVKEPSPRDIRSNTAITTVEEKEIPDSEVIKYLKSKGYVILKPDWLKAAEATD